MNSKDLKNSYSLESEYTQVAVCVNPVVMLEVGKHLFYSFSDGSRSVPWAQFERLGINEETLGRYLHDLVILRVMYINNQVPAHLRNQIAKVQVPAGVSQMIAALGTCTVGVYRYAFEELSIDIINDIEQRFESILTYGENLLAFPHQLRVFGNTLNSHRDNGDVKVMALLVKEPPTRSVDDLVIHEHVLNTESGPLHQAFAAMAGLSLAQTYVQQFESLYPKRYDVQGWLPQLIDVLDQSERE